MVTNHLTARFACLLRLLLLASFFVGATSPVLAKTYSDNGDGTVTDPTTGLTWMRCSMGQTWAGSTCTGTASRYTWDEANALTGTVSFAGQSDWRVPNIRELQTIVDRSRYNPAIDSSAFPNTLSSVFWSGSSLGANYPNFASAVHFSDGIAYDADFRFNGYSVRLVRGGQSFGPFDKARPTTDYMDHGNGTVTHTQTGLMWQRCAKGQTWTGSTCSGSATTYTWDAAVAMTDNYAGQSDWRLPTEDELISLVDYTTYEPAINGTIFPNTNTSDSIFWSGSAYAGLPGKAWVVFFADGITNYNNRSSSSSVRLVRGGQSFDSFALTVTKTGTGTVSGSVFTGIDTGIICGSSCTGKFTRGTRIILTATPIGAVTWSGACSETTPTCTVTMDAAKNVTANFRDVPVVSAVPASLTFANQNLTTTSPARTVTVTNTGSASLNITSIAASGDFAVTNNCGTGVGAGGFCTLNITFSPTATGTRTGTVTITDDAYDSPQTITLTGNGQGAVAALNATTKTFASQNMGTTSAAQSLTLTNTGGAVLNINNIVANGDFAQTTTCGATLAQGANCTISLTFMPTAAGNHTGSLVITSNSASSPNTITLTGTGVAVPVVSLSPTSLTFTTQALGTSSTPQAIALTNSGGAALSLSNIQTSGDFAQTNNCGGGLGAGGSCSISVTFTPTADGIRSGSVTITSNAAGSPHSVALTSATVPLVFSQGWNLLGNGSNTAIDVATIFSDTTRFQTIWKWVASQGVWAFYAPALVAQGGTVLADYVGSRGYQLLTSIAGGEGFWVNAKQAGTVNIASGTAVTSTSFLGMTSGWKLISIGNTQTASGFNADLSASPPTAGVIPQNIASLWAWDSATSKWYFYAPSLEAQGVTALADYITSKGYLNFTTANKTLGPGVGFWVNKP